MFSNPPVNGAALQAVGLVEAMMTVWVSPPDDELHRGATGYPPKDGEIQSGPGGDPGSPSNGGEQVFAVDSRRARICAVIGWLASTVIVAGLALAGWTALLAMLNRRIGRVVLGATAVVEVMVLAQLVASVVLLFSGERPAGSTVEFLGYQLATVLAMPMGLAWAISDRSRWAVGVLTVAGLAVAVMTVRMNQIWG